jgi:arginyl-tRNA synthetase
MLRTRSGDPVLLSELIAEAEDRAAAVLAERGMEGGSGLARAIGIGAIKYADLASDREKDYVFSWERMLAFEGNTSVYLQYANARARAVMRRAESEADDGAAPAAQRPFFQLRAPAERELALALLRLPAAITATLADYRPHKLCTYLHALAVSYSGFYEACPVLSAELGLRDSRLGLCSLTSRALELGLAQLGIEAPERLSPPPARTP